MHSSTTITEKDTLENLDKFPTSGQRFKLKKGLGAEHIAKSVLKDIISDASKIAEKKDSEPKSPDKVTPPEELKESSESSGFTFFALGCGEHDPASKKIVAELMNEIAEKDGKSPDFITLLGDNFEDVGPTYHSFSKGFDQVYHSRNLIWIAGIPFLVIPGNHDHGFPIYPRPKELNPFRITANNNNKDLIDLEVYHTYGADEKGALDPKRVELFKKGELDLAELKSKGQTWNMPGRYYAVELDDKRELFFIDSNTFAREYIEYYIKGNKKLNKQPFWLEQVAKNPETLKLLFLHHSLHTVGKRSGCFDLDEYLSKEEITLLVEQKLITEKESKEISYNEVLRRIFKKLGLTFDLVFAAHDHSMYHYNNQNEVDPEEKKGESLLRQVVAGGAGGDLQNRYSFNESTQCFLKHHGFVKVTVPPKKDQPVIIDYYTVAKPELLKLGIKGHHLRFSHNDVIPHKEAPDEAGVKELKELVISACKHYLKINPPSKNKFPVPFIELGKDSYIPFPGVTAKVIEQLVPDDPFYADDLQNHFNRYEANTFEASINYLKYALAKSPALNEVFKLALQKSYNLTFQQFQEMSVGALKDSFLKPKISETIESTPSKAEPMALVPEKEVKEEKKEEQAANSWRMLGGLSKLFMNILPGKEIKTKEPATSLAKPGSLPKPLSPGLFSSTKPIIVGDHRTHPGLGTSPQKSPHMTITQQSPIFIRRRLSGAASSPLIEVLHSTTELSPMARSTPVPIPVTNPLAQSCHLSESPEKSPFFPSHRRVPTLESPGNASPQSLFTATCPGFEAHLAAAQGEMISTPDPSLVAVKG